MSHFVTTPLSEPASPAGLQIRILGPLEVRVDGALLVVDTRKASAILALLAVEGRPLAREELAAMLWPESDDESARGALRRTLSVLRAALGDRWLRVDRSSVELDGAWVDLASLEAATSTSDADALRAAADLARGPFLAGFSLRDSPEFDDWRATRAVSVDRSVMGVLDRLASAAEASGDLTGAIAAAQRLVDLDSLDEPAHRRLMTYLARSGDRAGAIRQYRACVAVLERELGVGPLAETTELYEAIRNGRLGVTIPQPKPGAIIVASAPVAVGRLPMVGRDAELAAILSAYRAAGTDGRVVAVTGEAGIGKTRIAEAVAGAVEAAGGVTLGARAFASESGIAYGPVIELLRAGLARHDALDRLRDLPDATLGELERLVALPASATRDTGRRSAADAPGDLPGARARLLDALATSLAALVAGPVPGLVIVEDLHWADDASREVLAYLARRLVGRPMVLLLAWRPEDLDAPGATFAASIEVLPEVVSVTLGRLSRDVVATLAASAVDAGLRPIEVDALVEASEGLPLYIVEALAAGSPGADGPARTVRALLRERLSRVSETAGQVLAAAAVIGRSFDLSLVRGTSGRSEDETLTALEELVRQGIVREVGTRPGIAFDFSHARLREAAHEATGLARRRLLHRRTADLLRVDPAQRDDPGRLVQVAVHEREAGRDAEAAEAFRQAGLRERALYAPREAAAHLETALALGHPDVAGIQLALGEVRTAVGDYAGAIAALEAAAAVTDEASLPGVELRLGRVHARRGDLVAAASHLDAAIEADGSTVGDHRLLARALVERSVVAHRAGELTQASAFAVRALELAQAAGDDPAAGAAQRVLGLVARERGDLAEARTVLLRSLELAEADPDAGAVIAARNALALVEAASGDRRAAIVLLEAALDACRRTGERHLEAAVENNLADQLHAVGRRDDAMVHLKRAVAIFAEVGGRPGELEPEIWKLVTW